MPGVFGGLWDNPPMQIPSVSSEGATRLATLRRLVALRWLVLAAVALGVFLVPPLLGIALPMLPLGALLVLLAAFNSFCAWQCAGAEEVDAGELAIQLGIDLLALVVLLYLSGGAANPLISLLLVPVAVAAVSLPHRLAWLVAALASAGYTLLMWVYLPLAVPDPARAAQMHLAGMWLTFVLSAALITWFVLRLNASIRERDVRLAQARENALRDERVVALGALAAGAAHELGTPLATMAVLAGELEREPGLSEQVRADLAVLRQQVGVCKGIITGLAGRAGAARNEQLHAQPVDRWLGALHGQWHARHPRVRSRVQFDGPGGMPRVAADPTLAQGLTSLFDNAARASRGEVVVAVDWTEDRVRVEVRDSGPGFPEPVLALGGREPRPGAGAGAGLGLFLARAAVERLGGRLALRNGEAGGIALVELPRITRADHG